MYLYTNGFRAASNTETAELTIDFLQNSPEYGTGGNSADIIGNKNEIVASLIMSSDCALALRDILNRAVVDFLGEKPSDVVD